MMRDYDNMPVLDWQEEKAVLKAKAQILHQEPVILQMPDSFNASLKGEEFGCELQEESGIYYDCNGGRLLKTLAEKNNLSDLEILAEACIESSSQVDVDHARKRIIVHD